MIIVYNIRVAAVTLLSLVFLSAANAQNFDIQISNIDVQASPLKQTDPAFPGEQIRRGQEGWVRLNFLIDDAGKVIEPIVVDSTGGRAFEESALQATAEWFFEAPDSALFNNTADIRFEAFDGKDRATSAFGRRYQRIMTNLHYEQPEKAREEINSAVTLGGWNLYESSMLWLMIGRVEGAEGNAAAKLEAYRRALGFSNRAMIDGENRCDLLAKTFGLEVEHAQYASAQRTFQLLAKEPAGAAEIAAITEQAAEVDGLLNGDTPISAKATIYNPCDCDAGKPLWSYIPSRRTFSFSDLNGNVERFEVRCENERISDSIVTDKSWSLPADSGSCRVFVFGDDGASFNFVEHSENTPVDEHAGKTAVALNDVLDR